MSEKKQEFLVNGFLFREEELAEKAKREYEGIKYIRSKTNMDNPELVKQVYEKILEQKLFETPVGIGYLRELQEYLLAFPGIQKEEVKPIPIEEIICQEFVPAREARRKQEQPDKRLRTSIAGNIILVLVVILMFVITLTSKHPNILNYEEMLLNKYAGWEEELSEREKQVQKLEWELGIEP